MIRTSRANRWTSSSPTLTDSGAPSRRHRIRLTATMSLACPSPGAWSLAFTTSPMAPLRTGASTSNRPAIE